MLPPSFRRALCNPQPAAGLRPFLQQIRPARSCQTASSESLGPLPRGIAAAHLAITKKVSGEIPDRSALVRLRPGECICSVEMSQVYKVKLLSCNLLCSCVPSHQHHQHHQHQSASTASNNQPATPPIKPPHHNLHLCLTYIVLHLHQTQGYTFSHDLASTRRIRYTPQSHDYHPKKRSHSTHSAITETTYPISTTMSPIIARAAIRATRAAAQGQQAQFSVMRTMRNVARAFEPHPFQRLPIANATQAADWSRLAKRVGGQAVL